MNRNDIIAAHPKLQRFQRQFTELRAAAMSYGQQITEFGLELRDLSWRWDDARQNPRSDKAQLDAIQQRIDGIKAEQRRLHELGSDANRRGQVYGVLLDRCIEHIQREQQHGSA